MESLRLMAKTNFIFKVRPATACGARSVGRMAALQLVGIARYSSSSRLALYPMEHTAHAVQLPFLG